MKLLLLILSIVVAAVFALAGCSDKPQQTSAIQVESPAYKPSASGTKLSSGQPRTNPEFLSRKAKFVTTKSGLKCRDLKVGSGAKATPGKVVTVHYRGWLDNGVEFDSSRSRNEPFSFTLGRGEVIRGWEEGVVGMRAGGTRELAIPPKLGYGNRAVGNIPPNSTLHFEIELLSVGG